MRPVKVLSILAIVCTCVASPSGIEEIKIVANPGIAVSEISHDDLNRIFLMTKTSLPGAGHVEPVLETGGPVHKEFLKEYIGRTNAALMTYYRSLVFTGKASIPRTFSSETALIEYIAKTKGAIGYVSANANTAGVKTMRVKE